MDNATHPDRCAAVVSAMHHRPLFMWCMSVRKQCHRPSWSLPRRDSISSVLVALLQVRFEELQKSLKEGKGWQKLLRRTAATLRMPTYQVMAARGILPQAKREQSMQLTSTRVM